MEWIELWENGLIRLAGACVAAGLVWRYIVVAGFRLLRKAVKGIRSFIRKLKALTGEVEAIRSLVAEQNKIVKTELTTNGGSSALDKINKLVAQGKAHATHLEKHDERLHVIGELFTAHLADAELRDHHLQRQLAEQGIDIEHLQPRERWRWINSQSTDDGGS